MKSNQILFAICLALAAAVAQAQPVKSSILIGGTAGFTSTSAGDGDVTVIDFSPLIGYFVTDQVAVGGQITMNFLGGDAEGSTIGIGPAVRYYFNNSGKTRFFGQGNFNWQTVDLGDESESGVGFGLGAGLDYFFNQHVALEAILGYNNFKFSDADDSINTFGLNIGVAAFIGGGSGGKK
jgi:outer membrane protein